MLGGDHLVDADAGGEEAVVHPIGGEDDLVHLLDDVLRGHLGPSLLVLGAVLALDLDRLGAVLGDGDGVLLLELGLVLEPRPGGGGGLGLGGLAAQTELLVDGPEEVDAGGMDEEVGLDLLGVLGLANVDVDDPAPALDGGPAGLRQERSEGTGDAIVEAGANVDEEVALLHHEVGGGVAVHAEHVESEGVALVEHPHGVEGGGDGYLQGLGERQQLGGRVVAALPGDDDGLPRLLDEVEHFGHHLGPRGQAAGAGGGGPVGLDLGLVDGVGGVDVELVGLVGPGSGAEGRTEGEVVGVDVEGEALVGVAEVEGVVSLPVGPGVRAEADEGGVEGGRLGGRGGHVPGLSLGGHVGQAGGELLDELVGNDLILQVLGQVDEDGAGTAVPRHVEGVVHHEGHFGRGGDLVGPLGDGTGEVDGGTALEGRLGGKGGGLPAQHDEGDAVAHGVGDGGDEVGHAGAGRRHDDAGLHLAVPPAGGRLGEPLPDVPRARLVGVGDPPDLADVAVLVGAVPGVLAVELVEEGQDGAAGVAVDDRDVVLDELGVDDGGGALAGVPGQVRGGGRPGLVAGEDGGRGGQGGTGRGGCLGCLDVAAR